MVQMSVAVLPSAAIVAATSAASISFLFGALILMLVTLLLGRPVVSGITDNIPIILYTGVLVTGVGYFFYFKSIELAGAATGAFAFFLKPAIAPVIAVIVLGEHILWNTIIGIALILAASLLNILLQKKAARIARIEAARRKPLN